MKQDDLIRLQGLPVMQNRVYALGADARAAATGELSLHQDPVSGIVVNRAFDPSLLVYGPDYQNEQAWSPAFQQHLAGVMDIVRRHFADPRVIEVGCGKGYFLEQLRAAGYDALGVDPAYEGESAHVLREPFTPSLGVSAPAIVLRHVLEHMQDPLAFLAMIAAANGGQGRIYIEVPCFDWICSHRAWFDLLYEHVNYFRADDFRRMFGSVLEAGHLFQGQYLYVVADLASLRTRVPAAAPAALPEGFLGGIAACANMTRESAGPVALWGGASKGVLFAHHMAAAGIAFDCAIDINPAKQDRHMAGSGLRIVSPQEALRRLPPGTLVFVMNSNYHEEMRRQSQGAFRLVNVDSP